MIARPEPNVSTKITPIFRWAGSKRQILARLASLYPIEAERYVEPFAGSAALFFHLRPTAALIGDINPHLIGTYRSLRHSPSKVIDALAEMPESDREHYYTLRSQEVSSLTSAVRAARFIYLNRYCFNGLYRTNSSGRFNVPFSGSKNGALPTSAHLRAAASELKRAELIVGDFRQTLAQVRRGDFVYLDPPYWVPKRRVFREYDASQFDESALDSLADELRRLESLRIPYIVSYGDSVPARKLAQGRVARRIRVRRNIAGFGGSRRYAYELLITPRYMTVAKGHANA